MVRGRDREATFSRIEPSLRSKQRHDPRSRDLEEQTPCKQEHSLRKHASRHVSLSFIRSTSRGLVCLIGIISYTSNIPASEQSGASDWTNRACWPWRSVPGAASWHDCRSSGTTCWRGCNTGTDNAATSRTRIYNDGTSSSSARRTCCTWGTGVSSGCTTPPPCAWDVAVAAAADVDHHDDDVAAPGTDCAEPARLPKFLKLMSCRWLMTLRLRLCRGYGRKVLYVRHTQKLPRGAALPGNRAHASHSSVRTNLPDVFTTDQPCGVSRFLGKSSLGESVLSRVCLMCSLSNRQLEDAGVLIDARRRSPRASPSRVSTDEVSLPRQRQSAFRGEWDCEESAASLQRDVSTELLSSCRWFPR